MTSDARLHVWQTVTFEDGETAVDLSAYDIEVEGQGHSGPKCQVCGFFFCQFCHRAWWQSECPGVEAPGVVASG